MVNGEFGIAQFIYLLFMSVKPVACELKWQASVTISCKMVIVIKGGEHCGFSIWLLAVLPNTRRKPFGLHITMLNE